jgi:hypothetical protein
MRSTWSERFAFLVLMAVVFAWAAMEAQGFPSRARVFPQTVALLALVLVVPAVVQSLRERSIDGAEEQPRDASLEGPLPESARRQWTLALPYLAAMGLYLAVIALIGFLPASFLFVALFVFRFGGISWWRSLAMAAVFTLALFGLVWMLDLTLPGGEWISRR